MKLSHPYEFLRQVEPQITCWPISGKYSGHLHTVSASVLVLIFGATWPNIASACHPHPCVSPWLSIIPPPSEFLAPLWYTITGFAPLHDRNVVLTIQYKLPICVRHHFEEVFWCRFPWCMPHIFLKILYCLLSILYCGYFNPNQLW